MFHLTFVMSLFYHRLQTSQRSLLAVGANETDTVFVPVSDFAASAIVRARRRAVVETLVL